jgi:Bacteriophage head to tail connecting protein
MARPAEQLARGAPRRVLPFPRRPVEKADGKRLIAQYEELRALKRAYEPQLEDAAHYVLPRKSGFADLEAHVEGGSLTDELYDSTGIWANELLAAALHGGLTPASAPWAGFRFRDDAQNEAAGAKQFQEQAAKRLHKAYRQSNLTAEIDEVYLDLGLGTAALYAEERDETAPTFSGFRFEAWPLREVVFAENAQGRVDTVMREVRLSHRAAAAEFGEAALPAAIRTALAAGKGETKATYVHAVYPRPGARPTGRRERLRAATALPWASCIVEKASKKVVREKGYHEFPVMCPRWRKRSGEVYGRGPADTALPDLKTLNKAQEYDLRRAGKQLDPPLMVESDTYIGNLNTNPANVIYVETLAADHAPRYLEAGGSWPENDAWLQRKQLAVQKMFYSDQLQFRDSPQMSATEVQLRYQLMQQVLGPTLGRIESELLNPLIERTFGLMLRRGAFDDLLEGAPELADQELDVEYENPLARAARLGQLLAIQRLLELIIPLAEINPEIVDLLDDEAIVREAAEILDVPAPVLRDPKKVKALRERRQLAQGEQLRALQAEQMAGALAKTGAAAASFAKARTMPPAPGGTT